MSDREWIVDSELKFREYVGCSPSPTGVHDGVPHLLRAVELDLPDIVRGLLSLGADIQVTTEAGVSALHWAAYRDRVEIGRILLSLGASVRACTKDGVDRVALGCVLWGGGVIAGVVGAWFGGGCATNYDLHTPLLIACVRDRLHISGVLLSAGAEVDAKTNGGVTGLMWAVRNGSEHLTQRLLQAGADMHLEDSVGMTAMDWAIGRREFLLPLLKRYESARVAADP